MADLKVTSPAVVFACVLLLLVLALQLTSVSAQPCPEFCLCNGTARVVVICEQQSFTEVPPLQFTNMDRTYTVTLGDNHIRRLPRYGFFHLGSLRRLYLYRNQISDIHVDAFRNLRNLALLSLASNNISTLPAVLFEDLASLQNLYLHENMLTGSKLSHELFQPIAHLKLLTLKQNNISFIQRDTFSSLSQLNDLVLSQNPLSRLDDGVFDGLTSLTNLDLALCRLTSLNERMFRNLTSLQNLDLSYNSISHISRLHFVDLVELTDLHLQFNRIVTIDDGAFFRLSKLKRLLVHENGLTTITPGMFSGLIALQTLWVHGNLIEVIEDDTFRDLGQLKTLYLQNNRLTSLSYCQFKGATLLGVLVLQYNQISCIADSAFCCLPYLSRLYLGVNDIQLITPRTLACLTELTRLSLSGNRIEFVADGAFNSLTSVNEIQWDYSAVIPSPSVGALSNDIRCDCNAVYFRGFLDRFPSLVNGVRCASPASLRTKVLNSVHQDSLNCTKDVSVSIVIDDYKSPTAFRVPPSPSSPAAVETIVVPRGDDLHLVSRASPPGVVFWTKAGKALPAHDCLTVTPQGNLFLKAMTPRLEGLYTLVVQSASGATAHSVFVSVGEPAQVVISPNDVEMNYPGDNVMLVCVVDGKPKPTTYWMKDDVRLNTTVGLPESSFTSKSGRVIMSEGRLYILDTRYSDSGVYTCVADNGIGRGDRREAEIFFRRATPCMPSCRNNGTCLTTKIHTCGCTKDFIGEVCERPKPQDDDCGDSLTGSGCGSGEDSVDEISDGGENIGTDRDDTSVEDVVRPAAAQAEDKAVAAPTPATLFDDATTSG